MKEVVEVLDLAVKLKTVHSGATFLKAHQDLLFISEPYQILVMEHARCETALFGDYA